MIGAVRRLFGRPDKPIDDVKRARREASTLQARQHDAERRLRLVETRVRVETRRQA